MAGIERFECRDGEYFVVDEVGSLVTINPVEELTQMCEQIGELRTELDRLTRENTSLDLTARSRGQLIDGMEEEIERLTRSIKAVGSMPGKDWLICQAALAEALHGGGKHLEYVLAEAAKAAGGE